jgi:hypothetical protein
MKTGKQKLETIVNAFPGRKVGIDRLTKYTGLSKKSVTMYVSWFAYGNFHNGKLNIA